VIYASDGLFCYQIFETSGVPQGSILAPFYSYYIHEWYTFCIALAITYGNIDLYADDSTIYASDHDLNVAESKFQQNLNAIDRWCNLTSMLIHPNKTKKHDIMYETRSNYCNELTICIAEQKC
jgi:hypothetical protein